MLTDADIIALQYADGKDDHFVFARAIESKAIAAYKAKLREQNEPVAEVRDNPDDIGNRNAWAMLYDETIPVGTELFEHPVPISEDDGAKYRLIRKLLSTNMLNYYLLEGKSEETIDEWVDEVIAAARSE